MQANPAQEQAALSMSVISDLSTCALGVNLSQSTVIYRAAAARHSCCGHTLGSTDTRLSKCFTGLIHLPCPVFNGSLSPLSTCSQPSVAQMNTDPINHMVCTWVYAIVFELRAVNWSTRSSCCPTSSLGQNQAPKHILPG